MTLKVFCLLKKLFGSLLLFAGGLMVLLTTVWLVAYAVERVDSAEPLSLLFGAELMYWLPVALFLAPGSYMAWQGWRIRRNQAVSRLSLAEAVVVFTIVGLVTAMVLPLDNFSYVAASIIRKSVAAVQPLQVLIEAHYKEEGRFPGKLAENGSALALSEKMQHVKEVTVGHEGRIILLFDTRDINWGWQWWHRFLLRKNNDLTGLTLVLVPSVVGKTVVWDECEEGTVPKRNRHFKCSGHR